MSVVLVIAFFCMTAAACGKTDKRDANVSDSDDTATKKVFFPPTRGLLIWVPPERIPKKRHSSSLLIRAL